MIYECSGTSAFWLTEVVDNFLHYVESLPQEKNSMLICAAGMTPSAPIHFGILREIALSAFVADELKRRNIPVKLIYFWDDYDHFCKIPSFKKREEIEEHLGKNLRNVPDLLGGTTSYGEHIMESFESVLKTCGFFPEYDYQWISYHSGRYDKYMEEIFNRRKEVFDLLHEDRKPYSAELEEARENFYPFEVYCNYCKKDSSKIDGYDAKTKIVSYTCKNCGYKGTYTLGKDFEGKLFWKINWAMRWVDSEIVFESSGENQLTDTGSYAVAKKISNNIFGRREPFSLLYRFIGAPGVAKVSRALGKDASATTLTDVLEPVIIRWLLIKNSPDKPFVIDIGNGIVRLYNEWDKFEEKVRIGDCTEIDKKVYEIACEGVVKSRVTVPFRTIATALGIANRDEILAVKMLKKILKIDVSEEKLHADIRPRMSCVSKWLYDYNHVDQEPKLQQFFNRKTYESFDDKVVCCLKELATNLNNVCTEESMTEILYAIPKKLTVGEENIKKLRKDFFQSLYILLLGQKQGPKLGTLLSLVEPKILKQLIIGE